jgi:hypothetical protein
MFCMNSKNNIKNVQAKIPIDQYKRLIGVVLDKNITIRKALSEAIENYVSQGMKN